MMGVGPTDAGKLTYWQYSAMRYVWNARHKSPDESVEPPTEADVRARMAELQALGIAGR